MLQVGATGIEEDREIRGFHSDAIISSVCVPSDGRKSVEEDGSCSNLK
jgi:hypothetical protein